MIAVVTGAAGHLGGCLVRRLVEDGRKVRAVVHEDTRALQGVDVERVPGDVCDQESLRRAFDGADVVFHLAARISILNRDPACEDVNVRGVRSAAEAALAAGVRRFVHVSSVHAFDQEPPDQPLDESRARPSRRDPPYDRSKAAGEAQLREVIALGLDATIVNPTAILGPYDFRPSRMGEVLLMLADGGMAGLVEGGFDWVDVRDVVEGILAAEQKGRTGANYLLSGEYRSVTDLGCVACAFTGAPLPRFTSPMWLARIGAPFVTGWSRLTRKRPLYTSAALHALRGPRHVCSERARAELGYRTRPFEQTIRDAYLWFAGAGVLRRPLPALPAEPS